MIAKIGHICSEVKKVRSGLKVGNKFSLLMFYATLDAWFIVIETQMSLNNVIASYCFS